MQPAARKKGRFVGIDYGTARIGLTISDETHIIATPYKTITCAKKLDETVAKVKEELLYLKVSQSCDISGVVIGLPLRMKGNYGIQADEVKIFADKLSQQMEVEIILWDERLTTVQAEKALREANMTRKKRVRHVDNIAATIMLQSYLDSRALRSNTGF